MIYEFLFQSCQVYFSHLLSFDPIKKDWWIFSILSEGFDFHLYTCGILNPPTNPFVAQIKSSMWPRFGGQSHLYQGKFIPKSCKFSANSSKTAQFRAKKPKKCLFLAKLACFWLIFGYIFNIKWKFRKIPCKNSEPRCLANR